MFHRLTHISPLERQAPNNEFSGSGNDYGDEEVADEFTGLLRSSYSCII